MNHRIQAAPPAVSRPPRRLDSASANDARSRVVDELHAWRRSAVPERATPLYAEDLVRLLRDCMSSLGLDHAIAEGVSVNTVHYYRRKDIIDPPAGRTVAARYDIHHFWQVAGARLAGHLGLATLAEARDAVRGTDETAAMNFLAARVVDARSRHSVHETLTSVRSVSVSKPGPSIRPLPNVHDASAPSTAIDATVVTLSGGVWCVIPVGHAAVRSPRAAKALADSLASALRSIQTS